jgi:hypothetical protein
MNRTTVLSVAAVLVAATGLALWSPAAAHPAPRPAAGPAPGPAGAPPGPTRFRIQAARLTLAAGSSEKPLGIDAFQHLSGAIVPTDSVRRGENWFGAVRTPEPVLAQLAGLGHLETVFSGETELTRGSGMLSLSREFPVHAEEIRGDQTIQTVRFEKSGLDVQLTPAAPSHYTVEISLKAVSAVVRDLGVLPVITTMRSTGEVWIPDGYTAVFCHTDRIPGELIHPRPEAPGVARPADVVVQYFVLLTRLDLTEQAPK